MAVKNKSKKINKHSNLRDKSTIKRLKTYSQKPLRNKKGALLKKQPESLYISKEVPESARVQPDRRWFGNTRVINQQTLDSFRTAFNVEARDPYRVVLKRQKLPLSLLQKPKKKNKINLLTAESFESTFGPKSTLKRPKLESGDMNHFAKRAEEKGKMFEAKKNSQLAGARLAVLSDANTERTEAPVARECIFSKGQSRRIWSELYKVIDSSDVVLQVLDARDPEGTRSYALEKMFAQPTCHKNLAFVLNKCDLVPKWVVARWIELLSRDFPAVAFHASLNNPFGKGALIKLLRQYAALHSGRRQISVGFVGYPNVGKSSVINALKRKKVCKVAPLAGETKVWQYVTLFKRVYLIDCPGVVRANADTDADVLLKGVVRVESVENPEQYIGEVLRRVKKEFIQRAYGHFDWSSPEDFLEKFARRSGKLLKGGEPDLNNSARMILLDWQRGKLAWYVTPPPRDEKAVAEDVEKPKRTEIDDHQNSEADKSHQVIPSEVPSE